MKKTTGIVLLFVLLALIVASCLRESVSGKLSVLRIGDKYDDKSEIIKDQFFFMFRLYIDGSMYSGFKHRDVSDFLIFRNGRLACIGHDDDGTVVCDVFKDTRSGEVFKVCHKPYSDPMAKIRFWISNIADSKSEICVGSLAEGRPDHKYDWGLTAVAMSARLFGGMMGLLCRSNVKGRSLMDELGFDYGRIAIGSDESIVQSILGPSVYSDRKHGVEYFGKFDFVNGENQLLGIVSTNGIIRAILSDQMLDKRVTCRCSGLEYMGTAP